MPKRLLPALLITALCGLLAFLVLSRPSAPALISARDLAGERWYRLDLNDRQIGYLHSTAQRERDGRWRFTTDLRFVLQPGQPVRMRQELEFEGKAPFALTSAGQWSERAGTLTDGSLLVRTATGYEWQRLTGTETARTQPADWLFGLDDYLAFEGWLRTNRPAAGAEVTLNSLDFSRQALVPKHYRVLAADANGYEIENPAPNEATRIRLDSRLRPTHMTLAGLFELEQVTRAEALAPRTALHAGSYHVPVDRALADHTRIRRLQLEVLGTLPAARLWPTLTDSTGTLLDLHTNPASGLPATGDELEETAEHPVGDPRIEALARRAVGTETDPAAQVALLTGFVHGFIRYEETAAPRHVLSLLDDPVGNCNEYADLLTTLARSIGIPARTVFGLAYADEQPPAFRFHAWNELFVDSRWVAADPTWNQVEVDATHIPMPLDVATALQLLTGGADLRFVVRSVDYGSEPGDSSVLDP